MDKHGYIQSKHTLEPKRARFIPAFGYSFLTPFYDFMMKWAARESTFKPKLVEQAKVEKDHRVLDIGCGTATLTILMKKAQPEAEVIGLDTDSKILEIAKSKIAKAGLDISLDHGTAFDLPYPDDSFDRVFSSMVFHHFSREDKTLVLREIFRVLKPEGELHVADLGKPQNAIMYLPSLIIRRLEETSENVKGMLPEIFRNAGFDQVEETTRYMTIVGTVALYKAQKPRKPSKQSIMELRAGKDILKRSRNYEAMSEEEKYYSLIRSEFRILAPFYDAVTVLLSFGFILRLRDKVVDFANASTGSRILDVGTGTGKQAFAFAKKGYDVIGIDLSEDMLKVAREKNEYENVKFEVADATNLPFEDNSFDASGVSFALHDMILPIREKALKEIARVTKTKGTIVIVDYALPKNKISRFLIYHFVKLYEKFYPEFIKSDLEVLLRKSGIEIEDELPVFLGAGRIIKGIKTDGGD